MPDSHPPVAVVLDRAGLLELISEALSSNDPRGALVPLSSGWDSDNDGRPELSGSTLTSWARSGRLKAFRGPRGKLLAWESDVRAAVEFEPVGSAERSTTTPDPLSALLADSTLESSR